MKQLLVFLLVCPLVFGQTKINLGTQARNMAATQLQDLGATRTSSTVLTIAAGNARIASIVYPLSSATATLLSGGGTAYIYIDSTAGAIFVASATLSVNCSGCTAFVGSAFPTGSIPLYIWNATSGVWAATGTDRRAVYATGGSGGGGGGMADPGANGIIVRTALNTTAIAVPGTDYATPTSGIVPLKGDGAGGFSAAGFADLVTLWASGSCSGFLKNDGTCSAAGGAFAWSQLTAGSWAQLTH